MKESVRQSGLESIYCDFKSPLIDDWVCFLEEWEGGGSCFVLEIPHTKSHASLAVIHHTFTSSSVII